MTAGARLVFVVLMIDAVLLAVGGLFYLPLRVHGVAAPVTILLVAIGNVALVSVARDLGGSRRLPVVPVVVWVVTVLVLGGAGPGNDVLFPPDWRSYLFLGAGVLPAAVVLARTLAPSPDTHYRTGET